MSQQSNQTIKSFVAAASIPAFTIVRLSAANTVTNVWTSTGNIIGVAADNASANQAVPVVIAGCAKVICNASIAADALVGPVTGTGFGVTLAATFTSTALFKHLGVALDAGSTNSVIEVLLNVNNVAGA